jgi:hypothetical protein
LLIILHAFQLLNDRCVTKDKIKEIELLPRIIHAQRFISLFGLNIIIHNIELKLLDFLFPGNINRLIMEGLIAAMPPKFPIDIDGLNPPNPLILKGHLDGGNWLFPIKLHNEEA